MYQGKVTIEEILEAAVRCSASGHPVRPIEVQNHILVQRLGTFGPNYSSEYSLRMRVEERIERFSTNRKKGNLPFYFQGLEPGRYNLTEEGLKLGMAQIGRQRVEEAKKSEAEQRSFLQNRTHSPNPPDVVEFNGRRFVRDYPGATRLKEIYGYSCQVCGCTVATFECAHSDACGYAEVHHIRALGSGHQGPDYPGNMLVLCPDHHAAFDLSTMALNPDTLEVYDLEPDGGLYKKGLLFLHESGHDFDPECLKYAWQIWLNKLTENGLNISDAERD